MSFIGNLTVNSCYRFYFVFKWLYTAPIQQLCLENNICVFYSIILIPKHLRQKLQLNPQVAIETEILELMSSD